MRLGETPDAVEKAARLAGISNYGFVDVNVEVQRELIQELQGIFPSLDSADDSGLTEIVALLHGVDDRIEPALSRGDGEPDNGPAALQSLRRLMLLGSLEAGQEQPFQGFPLEIRRPEFYYLYAANGP